MSDWQKIKIGKFLFERKGKYKPKNEALAGLSRIEKIDFSGNFHIGNKISNDNYNVFTAFYEIAIYDGCEKLSKITGYKILSPPKNGVSESPLI